MQKINRVIIRSLSLVWSIGYDPSRSRSLLATWANPVRLLRSYQKIGWKKGAFLLLLFFDFILFVWLRLYCATKSDVEHINLFSKEIMHHLSAPWRWSRQWSTCCFVATFFFFMIFLCSFVLNVHHRLLCCMYIKHQRNISLRCKKKEIISMFSLILTQTREDHRSFLGYHIFSRITWWWYMIVAIFLWGS